MFDNIIAYSIQNKFVIGLLVAALTVWGLFSLRQLPIDAVPDITNNQVQVITTSPSLATQEIEQFITTPVELSLQNIQQLVEIRSVSRFGLSVVTVVFEEKMDIYLARQLVNQYLQEARENIPAELGQPTLAPISTGLGEIYQYVVRPEKGFEDKISSTELRSIQDWIVKRQLAGIPGVVEVNTLGGYLKQYEVAVTPGLLKAMNVSITDIYNALANSNENTGGAYIEKTPNTYYVRTKGIAKSLSDIENVVVKVSNGKPILVKDVATVQFGKAPRYGALTRDGQEVVGGTVMMLKGANSAAVTKLVKERVTQIQKSLPEGVVIEAYLDREKLVSTAISTVRKNLLEGGLIVVFILVLMLGNWRAGLIVASVIPLAMLFAVAMMNVLGISANLMSLGAIDFGLIIDGAVIIVESIVHRLQSRFPGQKLSRQQMNDEVQTAAIKIRSSAAFGEIIILMVYLPILALVGIEGKMFRPMAQTVMLAITGALILSLTYVPMMSALFLQRNINNRQTIADRIIAFCQLLYSPVLHLALRFKIAFVTATILLFSLSMIVFSRMGGEFIPTLEEGDLALHQILPPGSSLSQSVATSKIIQKKLMEEYPEIEDVVTKIGSAEIPTDPMPVETGDIIVVMKPKSEWVSATSRQEMFEKMEQTLQSIPGLAYEFSQPIQMRFNELMTGSRADIAVKLFGDDLDLLFAKAKEAERIIRSIDGVGTTKVEQTLGMPQIVINFDYDKLAQYGLQVKTVNQIVRAAFAGEKAGIIYEGDQRFDLVVRLAENYRNDIQSVEELYIPLANGTQVPLTSIAKVAFEDAPMQISRENTNRRIVIGVNVGATDIETLVGKIQQELDGKISLPAGYYFTYGGQFENLKAANARLAIAVPLTLAMIFVLLFFTFGSVTQAVLIFTAIPLSAIGGIWALQLRGMPFSISAGIGFIALFGVAVLNGIVLIGYFNQLKDEGIESIRKRIMLGTQVRLRPVLMTAAVASLGFLPMALSNSGGAEVQRPLATVVIGGLISATFLTLIILPILYSWLARWQEKRSSFPAPKSGLLLLPLLCCSLSLMAQPEPISLEQALATALSNNPQMQAAELQLQQSKSLQQLPYSLGETSINYQGGGLFRANNQQVNQLLITQNIPHPAVIKATNILQDELVVQNELNQRLTTQQLRYEVRYLYYELQQYKALRQHYQALISRYEHFYQIAETRTKVGSANRMEALTLQSALQEHLLLEKQTVLKISNLEQRLQVVTNTPQAITSKDSLLLAPFSQETAPPVQLALAQQQVLIEQAHTGLLQAETKPEFTLGYAAQHYYEGGWLSGLQAGIQVPLFRRQYRQKVVAQQLQTQVAQAQVAVQAQQLEQRQLEALNAIRQYAEAAVYYQEQLNTIQPEMDRIASLNYQAGELSYLELVNILNLFATNSRRYFEQVLAHNQALAYYQFLTNQ
ncbi:CusA/CzcA family heavy metal efflux RND transporter [Lewinella cohaerens]|uniref:CusA/CzcA family heavy metal efflux RND transporter n=1 Tax=Lewinella cohaerens TaxID=70995 RepID=UPI00036D0882|nr:CusA/CzcA family heavy metal efflux RND transporter [Lewinella cohaerens]